MWAVLGVALAEGAGTSIDVRKGRIALPKGETGCSLRTLRPYDPMTPAAEVRVMAVSQEGEFVPRLPAVNDALSSTGDRQRCTDKTSVVMVGVGK